LQRFVAAGYRAGDGDEPGRPGYDSFPEADFDGPHELLMRILASQGIGFREVLIDRSFPHEGWIRASRASA
jgi:imidazoleglycerol-phosphate dehydratase/histidinol-phosphatase